MRILFADDFYKDYELYQTERPDELKAVVKKLLNGEDADIDESKHHLIGSNQDNLLTDIAIREADEIVFTSDLCDE